MKTTECQAPAELRRHSDAQAGHTPGPWRIGDAGSTVFGPQTGLASPKTVARLPRPSLPCKVSAIDENIANARLIAAAPELLAALEAMLIIGEYNPDGMAVVELFPVRFANARATIAKATGRGEV